VTSALESTGTWRSGAAEGERADGGVPRPAAGGDSEVMRIDLAVLSGPDDTAGSARGEELRKLDRACRTSGVFYVERPGVSEAVLSRVNRAFDEFFSLALEERMAIAVPPGEACGYEPLVRRGCDANDSFNCVFGTELCEGLTHRPDHGANRWPVRPGGLEDVVREAMTALHAVGVAVMSGVAENLGLARDHFAPVIGAAGFGSLRARRYPPQPPENMRLGACEHVDGLPLAIIAQNDVAGLETHIPGHGWSPIAPRDGTLVVQLGTLMARWTNDRYVPNLHRVINKDPARERRSLIYWFPFNPQTVFACLPTCTDDSDPPHYPPIGFLRFIEEWTRSLTHD
jgi:isopenicillin N synthase-like dioxygenase